jgi:hypothetical protein
MTRSEDRVVPAITLFDGEGRSGTIPFWIG